MNVCYAMLLKPVSDGGGIRVYEDDGLVVMEFREAHRPIRWYELTPRQARDLAQELMRHSKPDLVPLTKRLK